MLRPFRKQSGTSWAKRSAAATVTGAAPASSTRCRRTGNCEALVAVDIEHGHFGDTRSMGFAYAQVFHWDGAGPRGKRLASPHRRRALHARPAGGDRGVDQRHPGHPVVRDLLGDGAERAGTGAGPDRARTRSRRAPQARIRIPGLGRERDRADPQPGDRRGAPGADRPAQRLRVPGRRDGQFGPLAHHGRASTWRWTHENTYAQIARVDWRSDGTTR